jgi:hypothetical protein
MDHGPNLRIIEHSTNTTGQKGESKITFQIPLMWGSQATFQERNVASVIWDATNNMEDVDHLFHSSG